MFERDRFKNSIFAGAVGALIIQILFVGFVWSNPKVVETFVNRLSLPIAVSPTETPGADTDGNRLVRTPSIADVVKKANPAVVSVVISKNVPILENYMENSDPFADLFGGNSPFGIRVPRQRQVGTEKKEIGGGSGFLVSSDGHIVTNNHVISDPEAEYTVFLSDGREFSAKVVATDPTTDVGVIKIEAKDLPFLSFGDSDTLEQGQTAIAIGNALDTFRNTVSVGVISGLSRSITARGNGSAEALEGLIQTDAAINPGNSGGPLLNTRGEVVGVNVAVAGGAENIGFSIASNVVKPIVDSIMKEGRVIRPYIGVRYINITKALQDKLKLATDKGALVIHGNQLEDYAVLPGSPAEKAGIIENDIVTEVGGVTIDDTHSLASLIRKKKVGDSVQITILRKGEKKTVTVVLEEAPKEQTSAEKP